ncbi:MAG: NADH-quinone oxidoreductase subunit NuoN [Gammaproteobacteria bacterium]|nr:NADH-quinone oxidoreductase subunit NuoN [Gammaproteobacteria bacterium]MCP4090021.1 NADH-quinone oxidoreductase subunit NuoN [Gammaproteobacteria bacterium]MCP4277759.1 NADH-quinone oxidoreductase subunit NuoN [Gammaproteobacteria bacterium]MCP4832222.1 NADH-quinone oxidoreductase subunit NuoN [Gammaproteobacteria bacterium]MCP4929289.1 NADH-quinone oxidoreductase subunit NuoN [Gammaproteobacteria bacterium]
MGFVIPEFGPAMAEIALATGICVVLLADLFISDKHRGFTLLLALITLVLTGVAVTGGAGGSILTFSGSYIADPLSQVLKLFTLLIVAVVFVYSHSYLRDRGLLKGEYYLLGLFATLGMFVMISAHSLITMYLGLELMSLALYAMVAFDRESPVAAEAAMKYFILGAIASGVALYGMSIIYGLTGSLQLNEIAAVLRGPDAGTPAVMLGTAFVLIGVAFKFGAVPFHNWVPDVYQGAATSTTLFIGTAPKLAAFAMMFRLLETGLGAEDFAWEPMLVVLAVLSLAVGNVVAIAQTNIKRMLAYSTIGHVGFILLGFSTGTVEGYQAALFYTIVYSIMAAGAFGIVILMSQRGFEAEELSDFKGLNQRSPWFAGMMLLVMVSMIGIPPFVGFFAKLNVLAALVDINRTLLAVLAVLFSVIGAFYYLRVIRLMYFDEAEDTSPLQAGFDVRVLVSMNGLAVLLLGLFANPLLAICAAAIG